MANSQHTEFSNPGEVKMAEYIYDFAVDGGVSAAGIVLSNKKGSSPLPVGALVLGCHAHVLTAVLSAGSATMEWGTSADTDGFSGAAIAKATLIVNFAKNNEEGAGALLWDDTNDCSKSYVVTSAATGAFQVLINTADLTAGKIRFLIPYVYSPA